VLKKYFFSSIQMAISNTILAVIIIIVLVVLALIGASIRFRSQISTWCDKHVFRIQPTTTTNNSEDENQAVDLHRSASPTETQQQRSSQSFKIDRMMTPREEKTNASTTYHQSSNTIAAAAGRFSSTTGNITNQHQQQQAAVVAPSPTLMHAVNVVTPSNSGSNFSSTGRQTPQSPLASVVPSSATMMKKPIPANLVPAPLQQNPLSVMMLVVAPVSTTENDEEEEQQQEPAWIEVKVVDQQQ
jgi:flagellar basal body-associated protein FliL